jgi:phosphoenolpyruvate synthase/pyruvate phosphate dikinase
MVDPICVGGVVFTRDPRGISSHMIIELSYDGAEAVTAGTKVDVSLSINRQSGDIETNSDVNITTIRNSVDVSQLVECCLRIENNFGSPQNIEWCSDCHSLWFLQTRPVFT